MAKVGRPRNYDNDQIDEICVHFAQYILNTDIPIVAEFATKEGILRESLYDYPEFSTLLKQCIQKKESALEKLSLEGKINVSMAIFSLKQLGWTDKQQVEHSGKMGIVIVDDVPEAE